MPNMPMGHGRSVQAGAKPKNFKRTLGQLIKYMRSSLPAVIASFLLAIAAVVQIGRASCRERVCMFV